MGMRDYSLIPILMFACLLRTCWLHSSPGHTHPAEWSQTMNKSRTDHTILHVFSSSLHLHSRTHCVSQLSPAARTDTSHKMFMITNSVKDTMSRAELMKDMSFTSIFHANSLGCLNHPGKLMTLHGNKWGNFTACLAVRAVTSQYSTTLLQ